MDEDWEKWFTTFLFEIDLDGHVLDVKFEVLKVVFDMWITQFIVNNQNQMMVYLTILKK